MPQAQEFPYQDGDVTVLGPEIFASKDGTVISWRGENYVPQKRLHLAHQARRAKEHQLDGIRRALCDTGVIQDDDPYSHADLEDVIRQAGGVFAASDLPHPPRCCGRPEGAVCVHDVMPSSSPLTRDRFVPPAAGGLPAGALDSATGGATMLDAWAEDGHGRNFLAHALVQLARDGWLRRTPDPEAAFDAVEERPARDVPAPQEAP